MVHLGNKVQVDARFDQFGDSAFLNIK
jgi:hypothetical protein